MQFSYVTLLCHWLTLIRGVLGALCWNDPNCVGFSSDGRLYREIGGLVPHPTLNMHLKVATEHEEGG